MHGKKIGWIILGVIAFGGLFVIVTMLLWNWLIPTLFNGPELTFLQTLGLLVLAKIIFGMGKGSSSWKSYKRRKHYPMSREEKEMLRQKFMERCGWEKKEESAEQTDESPNQPSI